MFDSLKVVLVTDQALLAEGLRSVLDRAAGAQVIAVYPDVEEILERLLLLSVAVVVLDVEHDDLLASPARLMHLVPECLLVLLSRSVTPELAYRAQEIGASGALATTSSPGRLVECLQRIARGERVFDCAASPEANTEPAIHLTPRETELFSLVTQGLKNKEISTCLGITEGTVKVYLSRLFTKVGAKDRFELALFGLKHAINQESRFLPQMARRSARSVDPLIQGLDSLIASSVPVEHPST
jgi:DNA-binding NarL/FixJ family response regulator